MFRFLGRNWEPITAILALTMSALSTWMAFTGINLANAGISLTEQAQKEERQFQLLSRIPVLQFTVDYPTSTISITNNGLGPAFVYAYAISYQGKTEVFRYDDDGVSNERLASSIEAAFKSYRVKATLPLGVMRLDNNMSLISLDRDASLDNTLSDAFSKIGIAACFMDVTGEFKAVASSPGWPKDGPELCGNPPTPLKTLAGLNNL